MKKADTEKKNMKKRNLAIIALSLLALCACGGSQGSKDPAGQAKTAAEGTQAAAETEPEEQEQEQEQEPVELEDNRSRTEIEDELTGQGTFDF